MTKKTFSAIFAASLFLAACSATDQDANRKIGATAGTVIGAVIGSKVGGSFNDGGGKIMGASLGAIFGSLIGKEIAKTMSDTDMERADTTAQDTMETANTGQTVQWSNPDSGNSGTYKPTGDARLVDGKDCRDFDSSIIIDGKEQTAIGRACRQPDGSWKIVQ